MGCLPSCINDARTTWASDYVYEQAHKLGMMMTWNTNTGGSPIFCCGAHVHPIIPLKDAYLISSLISSTVPISEAGALSLPT